MILDRNTPLNIEQILHDTETIAPNDMSAENLKQILEGMPEMQHLYNAAIRKVSSRLETLDDEFKVLHSRNPIHHMESRLKSTPSMMKKLIKKGYPTNIESSKENLTDIAGIRVICHYINDVYTISKLLSNQEDITIIRISDYIKNPKPNGYRSLHFIVSVPIFLSEKTEQVPVEIQIRTIAMDFWSSLEHQLRYKSYSEVNEALQGELKECAEEIVEIDLKMQKIYNKINKNNTNKNQSFDFRVIKSAPCS